MTKIQQLSFPKTEIIELHQNDLLMFHKCCNLALCYNLVLNITTFKLSLYLKRRSEITSNMLLGNRVLTYQCTMYLSYKCQLLINSIRLLGYRFKVIYLLVGPGPIGGVPSVGIFLGDPSPYLREFQRKSPKNRNG